MQSQAGTVLQADASRVRLELYFMTRLMAVGLCQAGCLQHAIQWVADHTQAHLAVGHGDRVMWSHVHHLPIAGPPSRRGPGNGVASWGAGAAMRLCLYSAAEDCLAGHSPGWHGDRVMWSHVHHLPLAGHSPGWQHCTSDPPYGWHIYGQRPGQEHIQERACHVHAGHSHGVS